MRANDGVRLEDAPANYSIVKRIIWGGENVEVIMPSHNLMESDHLGKQDSIP